MKASLLLRQNIRTLLSARKQTAHDLAFWCRRTDAWVSRILSEDGERGIPLKYLDRIADFFGIATYQLFQPGISPLTERRHGKDRRGGMDRRISASNRQLPTTPIRQIEITPADEALLAELRGLTHAEYERIRHWVQVTRLGRSSGPAPIVPAETPPVAAPRAVTARRTRVAGRK